MLLSGVLDISGMQVSEKDENESMNGAKVCY